MIARTLAAALIILASVPARAMEYSLGTTDESRFIYASGSIEEGEAKRFLRFLAAQEQWTGKTFLALDSPGGMVADALALARLVERAKFLTSIGPRRAMRLGLRPGLGGRFAQVRHRQWMRRGAQRLHG